MQGMDWNDSPYDLVTAALEAAGPTASGGFFTTSGGAAVAGTSGTNGFAIARTTSQVLAVLYGAPTTAGTAIVPASSGTSVGGFFPNGVNGKINTV